MIKLPCIGAISGVVSIHRDWSISPACERKLAMHHQNIPTKKSLSFSLPPIHPLEMDDKMEELDRLESGLHEVDPEPFIDPEDALQNSGDEKSNSPSSGRTSSLGLSQHSAIWYLQRAQKYSSYVFSAFVRLSFPNTVLHTTDDPHRPQCTSPTPPSSLSSPNRSTAANHTSSSHAPTIKRPSPSP